MIDDQKRRDSISRRGAAFVLSTVVLLQLNLGLGSLQELHRAMGDDIDLTIAVLSANGKILCDPTGPVSTGRRPVIRFELHRAQRRQFSR
ncbi:MAG: hypothetical protein OXG49_18300 [Chloroflexi bacterium]|nr:hypothetical protein [Chloroflexota bacterium]